MKVTEEPLKSSAKLPGKNLTFSAMFEYSSESDAEDVVLPKVEEKPKLIEKSSFKWGQK